MNMMILAQSLASFLKVVKYLAHAPVDRGFSSRGRLAGCSYDFS